jgi:hypothetical protein
MTLLATCWSFWVKWTFSRPCTYCSQLFCSINPLGNFTPCLCVRGLIFYLQYQHLWSCTFEHYVPKTFVWWCGSVGIMMIAVDALNSKKTMVRVGRALLQTAPSSMYYSFLQLPCGLFL